MSFLDSIRSYQGVSIDKIIVIDEADPENIFLSRNSIVLVHATWSLPSVKVLRSYFSSFYKIIENQNILKFYVLNIDRLSDDFLKKLPCQFGGNGETFLVKDGKIVENFPHYNEGFGDALARVFKDDITSNALSSSPFLQKNKEINIERDNDFGLGM